MALSVEQKDGVGRVMIVGRLTRDTDGELHSRGAGGPGWIRTKDAATALSLSNLAFLPVWSQLIGNSLDERASYGLASTGSLLAAVINILLLAANTARLEEAPTTTRSRTNLVRPIHLSPMLNLMEGEEPRARLKRKQLLKDAATALSLANLFFVGAWMPVLDKSFNQRLKFTLFNFNNLFGLILDVGLLAAVFWGCAAVVRMCDRDRVTQIARVLFLLLCCVLICLHLLTPRAWVQWVGYFNLTELRVIAGIGIGGCFMILKHRWRWLVGALAIAALLWNRDNEYALAGLFVTLPSSLLVRWDRRLVKLASTLLIILFPFAAFLLLQNFWLIYRLQEKSPQTTARAVQPAKRVVWIIFDEMDYYAAFGSRNREVPLPEFARLQGQSLVATNAYPPADSTMLSLPALITGRMVTQAKPIHSSELTLKFEGSNDYVPWSAQPNVFGRAREAGVRTALVGWYHPYKRIIGDALNRCAVYDADAVSLPVSMLLNVNRALERTLLKDQSMPLAGLLAKWSRQRHIEAYVDSLKEAVRLAANPEFGLVFIHLPVPHPPGIYNRERDAFDYEGESSYFDNLALADRTLGDIRKAMEDAGLWDVSVVLASSDHWWRPAIWQSLHVWTAEDNRFALPEGQLDYRVPFLLKMPGQTSQIEYHPRFNTVHSQELLIDILGTELTDGEAVKRWLDQRTTAVQDPYFWDQSKD
ncbi:MAG TPA: sulfatase-like hydrolase/transferase [Blastocatellia bacterium]|nr:sulfatase-like hydrolase/transferase [Blastocatellia bacterium]